MMGETKKDGGGIDERLNQQSDRYRYQVFCS
jgi:hypothetical protein